jgi:hypothetical protein
MWILHEWKDEDSEPYTEALMEKGKTLVSSGKEGASLL